MYLRKMRILAAVTLVISTSLIITAIVLLTLALKGTSDRCDSEECKLIASSINRSMDRFIDPCDNIYKFTCGQWSEINKMPEHLIQDSVTERAIDHLHFKLNAQLRYPDNSASWTPITFVKQTYEDCIRMKESDTDAQQLKALVDDVMKESQGDNGLLHKLLSLGESIIFHVKVAPDPFTPSKYAIWLTPPRFNIDAEHLRNARSNDQSKLAVSLYEQSLKSQSQTIFTNPSPVTDAINFEKTLASTPALIQESISSKDRIMKMDFDKLQKALPSTSFDLNYLTIVNEVAKLVGSNVKLSLTDEVIVENLNYFKEIPHIIEQLQPDVLKSYLILRLIQTYGFALNSEFILIDQNYMSKGRSNMYHFNQTSRCLDFLNDAFPDLMSKVYSRQVKLSDEVVEDVNDIYKNLLKTLSQMIDESSWLFSSKSTLKDKLNSIKVKIGFPKWIQEQSDEWVKKLDFDAQAAAGDGTAHHTYVRMMYLKEKATKLAFDRLTKPSISEDDWITSSASLKVHYDYIEQTLEVPAAVIAESVHYNYRWPKFLKYARLGSLLAHHMLHAFDRQGVSFNSHGHMEPAWLPSSIVDELKKQIHCYVDKYQAFSDGKLAEASAERSVDENYADSEALRISFEAFRRNIGKVVKLPEGFLDQFTPNQLFIISYVSLFCGQATEDARQSQLRSKFLPLEYRAVFPIANFWDLSSQFSCSDGSNLNPRDKCKVW